jgi:hypothetical protein
VVNPDRFSQPYFIFQRIFSGLMRSPSWSQENGRRSPSIGQALASPSAVVVDRAVPRSGIRVERYFRFTRSSNGDYFLWLARKSAVGGGSGWSGLRFDVVRDKSQAA